MDAICSYCKGIFSDKIGIIAKMTEEKGGTREFSYCSHVCAYQSMEEKQFLYPHNCFEVVYNWPIEMCTNCGTFEHPTEFCDENDTIVERYRNGCQLNGAATQVGGKMVMLYLPTNFKVTFTKIETDCVIFPWNTTEENLEDPNAAKRLIDERMRILLFYNKPGHLYDWLTQVVGVEVYKQSFGMLKNFIIDYKVEPTEPPVDYTGHTHRMFIFHLTEKIHNPAKLYLPWTILEKSCSVPIREFDYGCRDTTLYHPDKQPDYKLTTHPIYDTFQKEVEDDRISYNPEEFAEGK